MYCETCAHPFARASANGRVCFCCLPDGAHHQLYQSALLPVGKDCKESRQRRGKVSISVSCWFMAELKLLIVKKQPLPLPYPPLPAQAPPAEAQSYTPSL